jgi:hypothetical protein
MITKSNLVSIISKYYLGGLNEAVKWTIQDNHLTINFASPTREMIGKIEYDGIELEDSTIAINDTSKLNKLIAILGHTIKLEYKKQRNIPTQLIISDNQFNIDYALADLMIIPKAGEITGEIQFGIQANLEPESIQALIKAKTALSESDTVAVKSYMGVADDDQIQFEFGGNIEYGNKTSYFVPQAKFEDSSKIFKMYYNSHLLKEILNNNKDADSGKIHITLEGLMKLEFYKENLKSVYYLVAKEK